MNRRTRCILRDAGLVEAREAQFARLKALFAGRTADHVFVLCGVSGSGRCDLYAEPERWLDEALDDLAEKADALSDPLVFRPLLVNPWPYGVHFIDRMFGADVYELRERGNWQARALSAPVGRLAMPDFDNDPTWGLARRIAEAFVAAGVTVPLLSAPVLSSALNIGMNLYGQELLVAMMADPKAAHHDLRIINEVICTLHRWFLGNVPAEQWQMVAAVGRTQPPGYGQICGCSCQLLSPELYREFIAPLDNEVLSLYPGGGMIHLCGAHTQHVSVWRELASFKAFQLNDRAAEDLGVYFNELRDDRILYVNPCNAMPVERIMQITGGHRLVIAADLKRPPRVSARA